MIAQTREQSAIVQRVIDQIADLGEVLARVGRDAKPEAGPRALAEAEREVVSWRPRVLAVAAQLTAVLSTARCAESSARAALRLMTREDAAAFAEASDALRDAEVRLIEARIATSLLDDARHQLDAIAAALTRMGRLLHAELPPPRRRDRWRPSRRP